MMNQGVCRWLMLVAVLATSGLGGCTRAAEPGAGASSGPPPARAAGPSRVPSTGPGVGVEVGGEGAKGAQGMGGGTAAGVSGAVETGSGGTGGEGAGTMRTAVFGAGCFWGVEHIFRMQVPGVLDAVSGYSGGKISNPTYQQVSYEDTGHAEVVQVTYDPSKVSYETLVDVFFRLHDPTQINRQGPDIGEQYRSVIFYATEEERATAEAVKARRQTRLKNPIATTIEPAQTFYKAEEYHQRYYQKTGKQPYCHFLQPE